MKHFLIYAVPTALLLALAITWSIETWKECRETQSFSYCVHLVTR